MSCWLYLFAGPLVWLAHFSAVYGAASVADVIGRSDQPAALWAVLILTAIGLIANALIVAWAARGPAFLSSMDTQLAAFWRAVGAGGALLSVISILWQSLPALLGH